MLTKLSVALAAISFSTFTQASTLPESNIQHDPKQCPVGMDGYYKITDASDMHFKVSRDLNNNLVLQFIVAGGLSGQPTIVHGRYAPVNSVRADGTPYVLGHTLSFCKDSAVYSKFISNDESEVESKTTKLTVVTNGLQVEQVAPTASGPKVWPRVD